jgi:hypothetical protein
MLYFIIFGSDQTMFILQWFSPNSSSLYFAYLYWDLVNKMHDQPQIWRDYSVQMAPWTAYQPWLFGAIISI